MHGNLTFNSHIEVFNKLVMEVLHTAYAFHIIDHEKIIIGEYFNEIYYINLNNGQVEIIDRMHPSMRHPANLYAVNNVRIKLRLCVLLGYSYFFGKPAYITMRYFAIHLELPSNLKLITELDRYFHTHSIENYRDAINQTFGFENNPFYGRLQMTEYHWGFYIGYQLARLGIEECNIRLNTLHYRLLGLKKHQIGGVLNHSHVDSDPSIFFEFIINHELELIDLQKTPLTESSESFVSGIAISPIKKQELRQISSDAVFYRSELPLLYMLHEKTFPTNIKLKERQQKNNTQKTTYYLGFFFDGTGCHKDNDRLKFDADPSNIGYLFDAYDDNQKDRLKYYYNGVGTFDAELKIDGKKVDKKNYRMQIEDFIANYPYPNNTDKMMQELEEKFELDGNTILGLAFGTGEHGGFTRIKKAQEDLIFFMDSVKDLENSEFVIDVFGFSRGASLARHFVNAVHFGLPHPKKNTIKLSKEKIKITPNLLEKESQQDTVEVYTPIDKKNVKIRFVGLFDTVGSFYQPGDANEGDFNLYLNEKSAESIYQIEAAHEIRSHFPLTSLYPTEPMPNNFKVDILPGVHADIGGGYAPVRKSIGKASTGKLNIENILLAKERYYLDIAANAYYKDTNKRIKIDPDELIYSLRKKENEKPEKYRHQIEVKEIIRPINIGKHKGNKNFVRIERTIYQIRKTPHQLSYISLLRMAQLAYKHQVPINKDNIVSNFKLTEELNELNSKLVNIDFGKVTATDWQDILQENNIDFYIHTSHWSNEAQYHGHTPFSLSESLNTLSFAPNSDKKRKIFPRDGRDISIHHPINEALKV